MKREPIFFIHIPKTAGTSFRYGLEHFFGLNNILYDYGSESKDTHFLLKDCVDKVEKFDQIKGLFNRNEFGVFGGHVKWKEYEGLVSHSQVVVFFRDPVARVVSEYEHVVRHYGYKKDIRCFYRTPAFRNRQFQYVDGLDLENIGFFGITEHYADSVKIFNKKFNCDVPVLNVNVGSTKHRSREELSADIIEDIQRYNEFDCWLYSKVINEFNNKYGFRFSNGSDCIKELEGASVPPSLRGMIGGVEKGLVHGWAVKNGSDLPVHLDIYVNEQMVDTVSACEIRPDLKDNGVSETGMGGFKCSIGKLSSGDIVSVREAGITVDLSNSPYYYHEDN